MPLDEITVPPAAAFLSYGLGVFEGLKAQRTADGRILLFRPDRNALRFQRSAERLLMAPFPADRFVAAVDELVRRNIRFVPPPAKGSLYIRPLEHATAPKLGLGQDGCSNQRPHHVCPAPPTGRQEALRRVQRGQKRPVRRPEQPGPLR